MEKGDYGTQIWQVLGAQNPNVTITNISDIKKGGCCVCHLHEGCDEESKISCKRNGREAEGLTCRTYEETFNITGNIYYDTICKRFRLKLEEKEVITWT